MNLKPLAAMVWSGRDRSSNHPRGGRKSWLAMRIVLSSCDGIRTIRVSCLLQCFLLCRDVDTGSKQTIDVRERKGTMISVRRGRSSTQRHNQTHKNKTDTSPQRCAKYLKQSQQGLRKNKNTSMLNYTSTKLLQWQRAAQHSTLIINVYTGSAGGRW